MSQKIYTDLDINGNVKSNSYKFNLPSSVSSQPNMLIPKIDGTRPIWYDNSSVANDLAFKSDVDNLQIGGRNLILNSDSNDTILLYGVTATYENIVDNQLPSKQYFKFTNVVRTIGNYVFYIPTTIVGKFSQSLIGKKIQISFYIRSNNSQKLVFHRDGSQNFMIDSTWKKVRFNAVINAGNLHFLLEGSGLTSFDISSVKIEFGDVATDWTPAPEDSGTLIAEDNRTIAPSELAARVMKFGFTSWNNNNTYPYADFIHLRSYQDVSGGSDNLVMFRKDAIGMRIYQQTFGSSTAYSSYKDVAFTDSSITGNAATATTLQTARTLTIGATGKTFNGSANVAWTLAEIGAQASLVTSTTATGVTNVVTDNTNTFLNITQNGASPGSSTQITGAGSVTVSSDTAGKLTITGTAYNLPIASASVLGGVKIGSGISIDGNGVISANTFTPGTTNRLAKFSGSNLADSIIYDNGINVGIGTTTPSTTLDVNGWATFLGSSVNRLIIWDGPDNMPTISADNLLVLDSPNIQFYATDVTDSNNNSIYLKLKTITGNTTLNDTYHNKIVRITASCTITIPNNLRTDFNCTFEVIGAYTAQFVDGSGATTSAPFGRYLKTDLTAMFYCTGTASNYRLNGSLTTS